MERWDELIKEHASSPDPRYYTRVLQTAASVVKEDLATFELEHLLDTLLYKPLDLLYNVTSKRTDIAWCKVISDTFSLLSEVVARYGNQVERYTDDIVTLCHHAYDPQTRKHALACLCRVSRSSAAATLHVSRYVAAMQETACRAPLALLVGTICEYRPELVSGDESTIWRTYLNILTSNKNSDAIICAVLQGINGLFKHFGTDLPTAELNSFYDKMAADFLSNMAEPINKKDEACITILASYASLFRERLARDVATRATLLSLSHDARVCRATRRVYEAIASVVSKKELEAVISLEILPLTEAYNTNKKYMSLRILAHAFTEYSIGTGVTAYIDMQTLEFELRNENVSYDVAEAVLFCIESYLPGSDRLLHTAILFYQNLPSNKQKEIVVYGILKAPNDIKAGAVTFLITQTCMTGDSVVDSYLSLWTSLLDVRSDDATVVEYCGSVCELFTQYVVMALSGLERGDRELPIDKLDSLLSLASHVISHGAEVSDDMKRLSRECVTRHVTVGGVRLLAAIGDLSGVEEYIRTDRCTDEALLCACCVARIQASDVTHVDDLVDALQIIFSRNDVEPPILIKSLDKLEYLMINEKDKVNSSSLSNIIQYLSKLCKRTDMQGKDARILRRQLSLFIANYGHDVEANTDNIENAMLVELGYKFVLNLYHPNEGITYKLNLIRILSMALVHEHPETLHVMLTCICANLHRSPRHFGAVLSRVVSRSCRVVTCGDTTRLVDVARVHRDVSDVIEMGKYISKEKSPGVRRMLSDYIEALLQNTSNNPDGDDMVMKVADGAMMMMSGDATSKRGGLDITESLLSVLKENNQLSKQLLPELIVQISRTNESNSTVFESVAREIIEKIELFNDSILEEIIRKLFDSLLENELDKNDEFLIKLYENKALMCMEFIKKICDYKIYETNKVFEVFFGVLKNKSYCELNTFYVLSFLRKIFNADIDVCRNMLNIHDYVVSYLFETVSRGDKSHFCLEAVLMFFNEYAVILLELQYQKTLECLANIIENLSLDSIEHLHNNLYSCISTYRKTLKKTPQMFIDSLEKWCDGIPIETITQSILQNDFTTQHALLIRTMRKMQKIFEVEKLPAQKQRFSKWPTHLLKTFARGYFRKSKMAHLTDLLHLSVCYLERNEMKRLLLEGHSDGSNVGLEFCKSFMDAFAKYLLEEPYILLDEDMKVACVLINDIVRYFTKTKCSEDQCDGILDLIDKIWPIYETHTNINKMISLLSDLNTLPAQLDSSSNPVQYVIAKIERDRDSVASLVTVLPRGDYSAIYRRVASYLPTKLSELNATTKPILMSLLDLVASRADRELLRIIAVLAGGDPAKGWWDKAIDSCMASLGQKTDLAILLDVYSLCWDGLSMGACDRLMLPLLRYSSSAICERFFCVKMNDLLSTLRKAPKVDITHYLYQKAVVDYTRAFSILQIAFEKIPPSSLESPNSALYGDQPGALAWHLVKELCKWSVRMKDASKCRRFQCANYNCLAAAICRRRPEHERFYSCLFDVQQWTRLVDPEVVYKLPIRSQWNQQVTRHPVSVSFESDHSFTRTHSLTRSRVFLRTLTENPLSFDLIATDNAVEVETQELTLPDSPLNSHECAATLTAVMRHVTAVTAAHWRDSVVKALQEGHVNLRWLVAQAICNSREELSRHARELSRPLFTLVAHTPVEENGRRLLNGLHVDILNTLIYWQVKDPRPSCQSDIDMCMKHLTVTCLVMSQRVSVFRNLLDTLTGLCCYVDTLSGDIETYLAEPSTFKTSFQILQRLTKNNVYIPTLLPTILSKLETKNFDQKPKMAELFGLAMTSCQDGGLRDEALMKFRNVLDKTRSNIGEYVKILYYAQMGYDGCCSEKNFRVITDLTPKIVGAEKVKCLRILTSYISKSRVNATDVFEVIDLNDMLVDGKSSDEALRLLSAGIPSLSHSARVRAVGLALRRGDARSRADTEVALAALNEYIKPSNEPPSKRPRLSTSPLLSVLDSKDKYIETILACLGSGACCDDVKVASLAKDGLGKVLSADSLSVRFTECFLLTVYLPLIQNNKIETSAVSTLLELCLSDLRSNEIFKNTKLRDEPLEALTETSMKPLRLLTMSNTYQATFKSGAVSGRRTKPVNTDTNLNVQMPIDEVLGALLKFSEDNPQSSHTIAIELLKCLQSQRSDWSHLAKMAARVLTSDVTLFTVNVSRVLVENGWSAVEFCEPAGVLNKSARGADTIAQLLYEEVKLHSGEEYLFSLDETKYDYEIEEDSFSIEGLVSAFGALSNWDNLTIRQKQSKLYSGLPKLWTDRGTFKQCLDEYDASTSTWFDKLTLWHRQQNMHLLNCNQMDDLEKFDRYAVIEALQWRSDIDVDRYQCNIQPADCLVEWAALLMIRSSHLSLKHSDNLHLSRSHELRWCERANEMALPKLVLDCVKRNTTNLREEEALYESECLQWLHQKILALKENTLTQDNPEELLNSVEIAKNMLRHQNYLDLTPHRVLIGLQNVILHTEYGYKLLTKEYLQEVMTHLTEEQNCAKTKDVIKICELAIIYYDEIWESCNDPSSHAQALTDMLDVLSRVSDVGCQFDSFLSVVINRLDSYRGAGRAEAVKKLIALCEKTNTLHLLPAQYSASSATLSSLQNKMAAYKLQARLLCDPVYFLSQCCQKLAVAVKQGNAAEWDRTFDRMREQIFENPYAGDEFTLLCKYKSQLYAIREFAPTQDFARTSLHTLSSTLTTLHRSVASLRIAELTPALTAAALADLLAEHVVRVEPVVEIKQDSIRRPVIIKVLLYNGSFRRYLHKCGECLHTDAAALQSARYLNKITPVVTYNVIPTSNDSGLIEYMEGYTELRSLIHSDKCDLDNILDAIKRPADNELIITPSTVALQQYDKICERVPPYALRYSIEHRSCSIQDFIAKRRRFTETLSSMTIICWLFGVGDRHLKNLLYSNTDGAVCAIDWGNTFQYGGGEMPPTRLTRNMMAVCDAQVLESKLQKLWSGLRDSHKLFLSVLKMYFKWMEEEFDEKFNIIQSMLKGEVTCYDITRQTIINSNKMYEESYLQLLDQVFDGRETKGTYCVEDQISHLLQQSTDRRILAVTRTGWEPWV